MVIMTNQIELPNVTRATPAAAIIFMKGPNMYSGEVAGSPPPANAPSNAFFNLCELFAMLEIIPWEFTFIKKYHDVLCGIKSISTLLLILGFISFYKTRIIIPQLKDLKDWF